MQESIPDLKNKWEEGVSSMGLDWELFPSGYAVIRLTDIQSDPDCTGSLGI